MQDWTPDDLKARLDRGERLFLKLWKKGCGACKLSTPAIERLEAANEHKLTFGQICTDDYPEILEIADSEVLPVFFVFGDKKMLGSLEGFKGLERLKSMIDIAASQ
jgi:thioredoxin-like negative regulator of GroEL